MKNVSGKKNIIISYEKGYEYEKWYVQGKRWNGTVIKRFNMHFICDCDQFEKYRTCVHVQTVRKSREEAKKVQIAK